MDTTEIVHESVESSHYEEETNEENDNDAYYPANAEEYKPSEGGVVEYNIDELVEAKRQKRQAEDTRSVDDTDEHEIQPRAQIAITLEQATHGLQQPSELCWACKNKFERSTNNHETEENRLYNTFEENYHKMSIPELANLISAQHYDKIYKPMLFSETPWNAILFEPSMVILHITKHMVHTQFQFNP
jgi:hypothetical protein